MTIFEAEQVLTEKLKTIYDSRESANISHWVIESVTETKRIDRMLHKNRILTPSQQTTLEEYTQRLLGHEPVQYILNETWFCGLKFYIDSRALIPRPETEELVEWIISNCRFPIDQLSILDIGTGSGCIPITLKRKLRKSEVITCDISADAIQLAKENAASLGVEINFLQVDFLDESRQAEFGSYDIIVSNPPYVPEKDRNQLSPNVRDFEPALALFAPDNDPLIFYRAIAKFGRNHLSKNGSIYLELPENADQSIAELYQANGYQIELRNDLQGKMRMLKAEIV